MSFPSPEHNPCPDMAEDEVTPEQLAAIAAENEEPEPVDYKPPAQKTVQELHELDRDDESLRKYKEALLGAGVSVAGNALCVCVCVCGEMGFGLNVPFCGAHSLFCLWVGTDASD